MCCVRVCSLTNPTCSPTKVKVLSNTGILPQFFSKIEEKRAFLKPYTDLSREYREGGIFSSEKQVEFSDLDFVEHVNNVKYIEWMSNDYYKNGGAGKFKTLEINYINQCLLNEDIQIFSKKDTDSCFYTQIRKSDDKEICRAKFSFS